MSTSSFSLPSASGVVSLLNEARDTKQSNGHHINSSFEDFRPGMPDRESSSSSSLQSPPSFGGGTGSSSDTGKDSLASTLTTLTDSSTDSIENGRLGDIKALRRQLQSNTFADIKGLSKKREGGGDGAMSSSETSQNGDDSNVPSSKKHRSKEALVRSESKSGVKEEDGQAPQMLDQERLAASPKPMNGHPSVTREETKRNVPMNMHKATSMSENDDANRLGGIDTTSQSSTPGGKRRYPCAHPGCDKTFSTSGHAARHNRIHTGSKPYRCTFPGCNASFSRQDNSLQHYRTHVLHPKSRANGIHTSFHDSTSSLESISNNGYHSPLGGLDAETEATVRMGRKALEEGTAIAVVHEIVDDSGRKGEAVQRMVGQPRGSRRGSTSSNSRSINGRRDHRRSSRSHAHAGGYLPDEGGDGDGEDDLSVGTSFSRSASFQLPPPSSIHSSSYQYPPPPPPPSHQYYPSQHQEQCHVNQFSDHSGMEDPWSQKAMSYPPPSQAYLPQRITPQSNMFTNPSTAPAPIQTHRSYMYGHGSPAWHSSHERPLSASASSESNRYDVALYDRVHPAYGTSTTRGPPDDISDPHNHMDGSIFSPDSSFAYDHRRSHSLGLHGRHQSRLQSNGQERGSSGPYPHQVEGSHSLLSSPGNRSTSRLSRSNDEALSLLPAKPVTRAPYSNLSTNGMSLGNSSIISPIQKGMQSRLSTKEMQLPLPSLSKLPCSSDRSTNAMNPTTPSEDIKMNRSTDHLPSNLNGSSSNLNLLPPLIEGGGGGGGGRNLPPLRTSPHSL